MNRFAGLLAVALVAAGTLAAQDTVPENQSAVTAEKPTQAAEQKPAPAAEQAPAPLVPDLPVTKEPGDSHVRMVRLSQVQGKVGMDRGTGHGTEPSMQNMPILEGMLLGTANDDSYAEVEFEDGSTLRLGPSTVVKFSQLVTRATGAKATTIRVDRGTVFISRENTKADEFTLAVEGMRKIAVQPSTHMRLELDGAKAEIAVFSGNVLVDSVGAPVMVGKKHTLTLDLADKASQGELAKKVEEGPYDGWDKDAQKYHERYGKGSSLVGGYGYGVSDLSYYGAFVTADGCGTFWQPYFASAAWNPYANGLWAQYPGGAYSWVSPYPWGWLPFHTGGWSYCPSRGWGWQPGGIWRGVNNIAATPIHGTPAHVPGGILPRPPVHPKDSLIVANQHPPVVSRQEAGDSFVFRKDSAGLGVPRGSLGKLNGFSNNVAHHGFANSTVYAAPAGSSARWNDGQVYHGPLTLHRGEMTDEARQAMWARQQAAVTNGMLSNHRAGQLTPGPGMHHEPMASQNPATGWQGHQGSATPGNNFGWKGQQGATNGPPQSSA